MQRLHPPGSQNGALAALAAALVFVVVAPKLRATDFYWQSPGGGAFATSALWSPFLPIPPNPTLGPGGASDTVNFNLGLSPAARYTVTGVNGQNDRLLVHRDSLSLNLSGNFALRNTSTNQPSFTVGLAAGDVGDVLLAGAPGARLETHHASIGHAADSAGAVTVDGLEWIGSGSLPTLNIGNSGTGTLTIRNGATVENHTTRVGTLAGSQGTVIVSGPGAKLTATESFSVFRGEVRVENGGAVISRLTPAGHVTQSIFPDSTATVTGTGSSWSNGGDFIHQGTLIIENGAAASSQSTHVSYQGSNGEVLVTGAGSTWNPGQLRAGEFNQTGRISIENGAAVVSTLNQIGSTAGATGVVSVVGAGSTWNGGSHIQIGFRGVGTLTVEGGGRVTSVSGVIAETATAAGSTATIAGADSVWEASDLITVGPGGAGTLAVRDGGTVAASGLVIGSHGTLRGAGGVVQNHVTNHNLVLAEASPNPFQVNGQLTQNTNGRIRIEIGSPTDFGRLSVEGALILTGTLEVVLVNGYLPAPGTQFDILDWGTRLGTFAAVQLPIGWDASQLYSTGVITAVNPHPPGDFNLDGRVDGADLLLWQRHLAAPFTAGDLTDWKSFFGVAQGAAASAAAVPEPAASVLLLAAAALGRGRRNPRATACQLSAAVRPRCEAIQARDCGRTTPSPFLGE